MLCQEIAPAFAVFRIPGLVQDRAEEGYVETRLFPTLREQARVHGMVLLALGLARQRRRVVARAHRLDGDAAPARLWQWELDQTSVAFARAMGLNVVPLPVGDAGRAYEDGRTDGFIAIPSAIFGFQWFSRTRVHVAVSVRAAVRLRAHDRRRRTSACRPTCATIIETASVKFGLRIAETTRAQDDELLGGLFERQGVRSVPVSPLLARPVPRRGARGARSPGHAAGADGAAAQGAIVPRRLPQLPSLI